MTACRKKFFLPMGLLLASIVVPAFAAAPVQEVKIGFSAPMTGAQAATGVDNLAGMQMAVDRLNAEGLVIGGKKIAFKVLVEDDQGDPRAGMGAVQKLVDLPVDMIIGPYNSGVVIPTSRLLSDAGIITLTVASNPKITEQGYTNLFRFAPSDSQLGGKMALYAAKQLHVKRVAVIDDRTVYGQGLAQEFSKVAKANGITVVGREYTSDKATDFNAILTSIKGKRPDAIFYGGYAPQGGPMRRQMKQLGMNVLMLGGESICSAEMGRLGGPSVDQNVYCTRSGSVLNQSAGAKTFTRDYQQRYQRMPEVFAASYYDGMMLLAEAMKKADSVASKTVLPVLRAMQYQGVAGSYAFDAAGNLKEAPVTIFQFKDGLPTALVSY